MGSRKVGHDWVTKHNAAHNSRQKVIELRQKLTEIALSLHAFETPVEHLAGRISSLISAFEVVFWWEGLWPS